MERTVIAAVRESAKTISLTSTIEVWDKEGQLARSMSVELEIGTRTPWLDERDDPQWLEYIFASATTALIAKRLNGPATPSAIMRALEELH